MANFQVLIHLVNGVCTASPQRIPASGKIITNDTVTFSGNGSVNFNGSKGSPFASNPVPVPGTYTITANPSTQTGYTYQPGCSSTSSLTTTPGDGDPIIIVDGGGPMPGPKPTPKPASAKPAAKSPKAKPKSKPKAKPKAKPKGKSKAKGGKKPASKGKGSKARGKKK